MTFSEQVPGPTLRVTQGDVVKMTLTIPDDEVTGHGNDMHASQMSAGNFESVNPGETSQYCYIAESAGMFKYHCSGVKLIGMDQHVLSGMYGITIVDPANGYKKLMVEKTSGSGELDRKFYDADALEFQLQYNQLYLHLKATMMQVQCSNIKTLQQLLTDYNLVMYQTWLITYSSMAM